MAIVDTSRLPSHVAIVMDGNGRWAEQQGWQRSEGHVRGSDVVREVVRACRRLEISALTLFAFSEQNWQRPQAEVQVLMRLLRDYLLSERQELIENGIRLRAIGRVQKLPQTVREVLEEICAATRDARGMTLTLAVSYGGREEIVDSCQRALQAMQAGQLEPAQLDVERFQTFLPSCEPGPVDLLIRTGGEQRISNFLLWAAAYAEFFFTETLWPDFSVTDLHAALAAFQARERRFGRIASDIEFVSENAVDSVQGKR